MEPDLQMAALCIKLREGQSMSVERHKASCMAHNRVYPGWPNNSSRAKDKTNEQKRRVYVDSWCTRINSASCHLRSTKKIEGSTTYRKNSLFLDPRKERKTLVVLFTTSKIIPAKTITLLDNTGNINYDVFITHNTNEHNQLIISLPQKQMTVIVS
jgi:hypothetical protein